MATGDSKEFGPGFYTMSIDSLASGDCALVGANWYSRVVVDTMGLRMRASDVSNQQGGNLPGDPWVVIGPQRPDFMNNARQIAWRLGLGLCRAFASPMLATCIPTDWSVWFP